MDCLFCKIAKGSIPSTKVYEDNLVYAFDDIEPQAPVHVLIIPKNHYKSILELDDESTMIAITNAIKEIAKIKGVSEKGFRVITNIGEDGGQSVNHLHFHLLGERKLQWPPG